MAEQQQLIDTLEAEEASFQDEEIEVEQIIVPDDALTPDPKLIASIKRWGIIERLLLRKLKNGRYIVLSGTRRLGAARILQMATVPARITAVSTLNADVLKIQAHTLRTDNALAMMEALIHLLERVKKQQLTEADVIKMTALSPQELKKMKGLALADKRLHEMMYAKHCTMAVAETIAKMLPNRQAELLTSYAEDPRRISMADVKEFKQAKEKRSSNDIMASLFEGDELIGSSDEQDSQAVAVDQAGRIYDDEHNQWLYRYAGSLYETLQYLQETGALTGSKKTKALEARSAAVDLLSQLTAANPRKEDELSNKDTQNNQADSADNQKAA